MTKKMPVRTAEIQFDGIYEGFSATVWVNAHYGTKQDLSSGNGPRFEAGICEIVLDWNFTDENGTALLTPSKAEHQRSDLQSDLTAKLLHLEGIKANEKPDVVLQASVELEIQKLRERLEDRKYRPILLVPDELLAELVNRFYQTISEAAKLPKP